MLFDGLDGIHRWLVTQLLMYILLTHSPDQWCLLVREYFSLAKLPNTPDDRNRAKESPQRDVALSLHNLEC